MDKIEVSRFLPKEFRAAESLKTLRTNLMYSGEKVKVIGITSFGASDGKTTISFHLAASFAQAGKRVLLLDTDLRKSTLQKRLKVSGQVEGLSHYLMGKANVNELMCGTDVPGLFVMFAGETTANAAELLGGNSFKKLIPALRDVFDYVIVDVAPLGQVIDCAVIAPEIDGTAIIIDVEKNSYKQVRRVQSQLEMTNAKILGVVLNRVNFHDRNSYYAREYGYGSYGYGYGEEKRQSNR